MLFFGKKKIESFEKVTINISGMRHICEYEIVMKDGKAEFSEYGINFKSSKSDRVLKKRVLCEKETALNLLNDCKILSWDGFYGKHPKRVLDGTMFTFKATVNGGKQIYASGSQNFPRHYHDFEDALSEILNRAEQGDK